MIWRRTRRKVARSSSRVAGKSLSYEDGIVEGVEGLDWRRAEGRGGCRLVVVDGRCKAMTTRGSRPISPRRPRVWATGPQPGVAASNLTCAHTTPQARSPGRLVGRSGQGPRLMQSLLGQAVAIVRENEPCQARRTGQLDRCWTSPSTPAAPHEEQWRLRRAFGGLARSSWCQPACLALPRTRATPPPVHTTLPFPARRLLCCLSSLPCKSFRSGSLSFSPSFVSDRTRVHAAHVAPLAAADARRNDAAAAHAVALARQGRRPERTPGRPTEAVPRQARPVPRRALGRA